MAIRFEQPTPFDPTASARAGAIGVQQMQAAAVAQRNAMLANVYGQAAARQDETANAGEDRELRASTANADRAASLENAGRERQFRLVENEQLNQQRQAQQGNEAQLQQQLMQTQLSQTEQIEYQRMNQAVGAINATDELDDHEKAAAILQVKAKIAPYEQRLAATKVQQEQLQTKQMITDAQKMAALESATGQARAKLIQGELVEFENPAALGGKDKYTIDRRTGQLHLVETAQPPKAAAAAKPPDHSPVEFDYKKHLPILTAEAEVAYPKANDATDPANASHRASYLQTLANREGDKFHRGEMTVGGQVKQAVERPAAAATPPQGPPPTSTPTGPVIPFTRDKPMNPEQKVTVERFHATNASLAARSDLPPEKKADAIRLNNEGMALIEKYGGDMRKISPEDAKQLVAIQRAYEQASAVVPEADQRTGWEKFQKGDLVTTNDLGPAWHDFRGFLGKLSKNDAGIRPAGR